MRSTILATIQRCGMLPANARLVVAVSGGPDSVCLLRVMHDLGLASGVAHFNHQLRGAESDEDERFVRELANALGLPVYVASEPCSRETGNLEQNARRARRRFFRELIASGAADRIALGHTLDDQAETVLFRILRGTGATGLAGILPVTAEGLIRPFLDVRRAEVHQYLKERGLDWREDSSNQSERFARNRIRRELLPQLEAGWNPNLAPALAHLADVSYQEELRWAGELREASQAFIVDAGAVEIPVQSLTEQDLATRRRLVRHAIRLAKGSLTRIDFLHVEAVLSLLESGSGRVSIPGLTIVRSFNWVRLASTKWVRLVKPMRVDRPGLHVWREAKLMIEIGLSSSLHLPEACDTLGMELRAWRPGDQYWPAGRSRVYSVKELFQKARTPSWRRAAWPILTSKDKILWVKQFGRAQDADWLEIREVPEMRVNLSGTE